MNTRRGALSNSSLMYLHFLIISIPVMPSRHFQLHFLESAVHWLKPMCYGLYPRMRWQTKRKNWDHQGRLRERPERRSDGSGRCISSVPKFGTAPGPEKDCIWSASYVWHYTQMAAWFKQETKLWNTHHKRCVLSCLQASLIPESLHLGFRIGWSIGHTYISGDNLH